MANSVLREQAAKALIFIDNDSAGRIEEVKQRVYDKRREFRESKNNRTIGKNWYGDQLASLLGKLTEMDFTDARAAANAAMGFSWEEIACREIVAFADELRQAIQQRPRQEAPISIAPSTTARQPARRAS